MQCRPCRAGVTAAVAVIAMASVAGGYDAVLLDEAQDFLRRGHVARRLHRLLTMTPHGWSVRVGLLGDWGEGKSTVARWAKTLAERDGHLVVWFAPAASATAGELWAGLATAVLIAVKNASDVQSAASRTTTKLERRVTGRIWVRHTEPLAKALKATEALQSAAVKFLEIGPGHLKQIRAALGEERRVVVVLDDLDRADPRLLPGLLLALRDVLDLPGYSFLLPFDERVVAASLQEYNRAWGDGRRFLDKILDFRVRLPPVGPTERRRLFKAEAAHAAPFLPAGAAAGLEEALPANPRRLKGLVRSISLLEEEARRHRPGELDWRSVVLASLMREESEEFFRAYVESTFNAFGPDGVTRRNRQFERLMDEASRKAERERVGVLLQEHAGDAPEKHARLRSLCEAWLDDARGSDPARVYYSVRLLTEASEGATWADHDAALELFREGRSAEDIGQWVRQRAAEKSAASDSMAKTLVLMLCAGYGRALGIAMEATLASEHKQTLEDAGTSLDLLDTLSSRAGLPGLPAEELWAVAFPVLLSEVSRYERFDRNRADADARAREIVLLSKWAGDAGAHQRSYIEAVESAEGVLQRKLQGAGHLRDTLRARLAPTGTEALARLKRPGGVGELLHTWGSDLDRTALLDPDGPLWRASQAGGAAAVLAEAADRPDVQKNALRLLELLQLTLRGDIALRAAGVPEAFAKSEALGVVWAAAVATPLQFRMLKDLRDLRGELIAHGAGEAPLPVPAWLQAE